MRRNRVSDQNAVRDIMEMASENLSRCSKGIPNMFVDASSQNEPEMKVYRGTILMGGARYSNSGPVQEQLDEIIALLKNRNTELSEISDMLHKILRARNT